MAPAGCRLRPVVVEAMSRSTIGVLYTKPRNPQSVHEIHGLHGLSMDYPVNSKSNMVGGNHTQIYKFSPWTVHEKSMKSP